jgi:hypothetical protein
VHPYPEVRDEQGSTTVKNDRSPVTAWRWTAGRVKAHWRWGRSQGWGRLVEEDQLDPRERLRVWASKAAWRRRHGLAPGTGVPVLVVGLQRSGTNMLVRGLEQLPQVEVHNENDRRVFHRFRIKDEALVRTCRQSRHAFILFKPLCDSHRTAELLQRAAPGRALAVWIYRDVDGRVRSSLAKFGASNRDALVAIAAGETAAWQAGGLSTDDMELVRSLDPARLDAASASALFWYLRNKLYFSTGLHGRPDVHLTSYEAFLADPEQTTRDLCSFLGTPYVDRMTAHMGPRQDGPRPRLELDPRVRRLCDDLHERLESARTGDAD